MTIDDVNLFKDVIQIPNFNATIDWRSDYLETDVTKKFYENGDILTNKLPNSMDQWCTER